MSDNIGGKHQILIYTYTPNGIKCLRIETYETKLHRNSKYLNIKKSFQSTFKDSSFKSTFRMIITNKNFKLRLCEFITHIFY